MARDTFPNRLIFDSDFGANSLGHHAHGRAPANRPGLHYNGFGTADRPARSRNPRSPLRENRNRSRIREVGFGLLDDVPVAAVAGLAADLLRWLNRRHSDLLAEVSKTGKPGDGLVLRLTDRINEYKAISKEMRLRHGLDLTDIPAPQGDRPNRLHDPDGGESSEDGHLDAAFDDARRDGIAGEPCGVV